MKICSSIKGACKSVTIWVNGVCLAILPFVDSLVDGIRANLPGLETYLPADVLKGLGLALIVFNIWQRTRTTASLAEKGAP